MGRLDDRVAIVTGGGRGIGQTTSLRLAADGASVVVNDIDDAPANETVALIEAAGGKAIACVANTVEMAQAERLVQAAVDAYGKIDIIVNNAGVTRDKMFHGLDDAQFDFVFDANLKTGFHTTLAAMPYLREVARRRSPRTARLRTTERLSSPQVSLRLWATLASTTTPPPKGAVIATTKTLARELGAFGINVNAVAPGFVETRLTAAKEPGKDLGIPEEMRQMAKMMISLGRLGQPEDIANVTAFLVSSDSDFVSGVTIPVTGGQLGGM